MAPLRSGNEERQKQVCRQNLKNQRACPAPVDLEAQLCHARYWLKAFLHCSQSLSWSLDVLHSLGVELVAARAAVCSRTKKQSLTVPEAAELVHQHGRQQVP